MSVMEFIPPRRAPWEKVEFDFAKVTAVAVLGFTFWGPVGWP